MKPDVGSWWWERLLKYKKTKNDILIHRINSSRGINYAYMKKELKIYIDTSVIGGCYDDEFAEWSKKLIEEFKEGLYIPVVSKLTEAEIGNAPEQVQNVLLPSPKISEVFSQAHLYSPISP